jgi:5'-methylthioadenosine phosphorylase
MAHPTDKNLMDIAKHTLESLNIKFNYGGTYLGISGPQFSTLSESNLYRSWKCDVIGMTNLPEVNLCREADLRYLSIGMVTDYDCWNEKYSNVEVRNVLDILERNIKNSKIMLVHFLKRYFKTKLNDNLNVYKSIVTPLNKIDKKTINRLKNIIPQLYIANN